MFLDRSMDKRSIPRSAWERGLVILIAAWSLGMAQAADPKGIEFFEKRVRPLLADQCYECHGEKKQQGGQRLDSAAAVLQGGYSGPSIVAGKPEQSPLIKAVSWGDPDLQMPPKNKRSDAGISAITEWVKMGAPEPRSKPMVSAAVASGISATSHWAYQPIRKPAP